MQRIQTEYLHEGMKFSAPVFFDDGKNMFLAAHKPLGKLQMDTIVRWNVSYVLTHGTDLSSLKHADSPIKDQKDPVIEAISTAVKNMEAVFAAYRVDDPIDRKQMDAAIRLIYKIVKENRLASLNYALTKHTDFLPVALAAVNTAIFSLVTALDCSLSQTSLVHIIIAALFHDLDRFSASEHAHKNDQPSTQELELLKDRPFKIAQYVTKILMYPNEAGLILLRHYEARSGKTYPEGHKEQSIDIGSRILPIAAAFNEMISEKTQRDSSVVYEVLKNLIDDKEKRFDPEILNIFVRALNTPSSIKETGDIGK